MEVGGGRDGAKVGGMEGYNVEDRKGWEGENEENKPKTGYRVSKV